MFPFVYGNDHAQNFLRTSNVKILLKIWLSITPDGAQKSRDFIIQVNFVKQSNITWCCHFSKKIVKKLVYFFAFGKGRCGVVSEYKKKLC